MKRLIIFIASCLGVIALCALIWFVFPFIAVADFKPFTSVWLRLALVMAIITIFCGYHAYRYYKRRNAAAALAEEIAKPAAEEPQSDAKLLAEKMGDAIQTLRTSRKTKGDFLYDLPWYIIIGPPGAGKTTALINSGLKFPLAAGGEKRAISGVGGTRYCDWWFTEDAVLIDTAGRYTTQDSDAALDRKSWLAFLKLLKTHRPLQPVNGVLIAISLADIMSASDEELNSHSAAIRRRLSELHEQLGIDFPVYVLFTKADLVAGFIEFFANLGEQRRRAVWGATFQVENKTENKVNEATQEFDLLIDRLSQEMPDRLQEEGDPLSRVRIYGFPTQMAGLKAPVIGFLNQIFEPTRYHTNIPLRGFYFTSGTQEGTPIDRLLASMPELFERSLQATPMLSGKAKSYFLGDLLTKVIFGEAGWVTTNRNAQRRKALFTYAGYGAVGVAAAVVLGAWWMSYLFNTNLIAATDRDLIVYKDIATAIVNEDPVADTDFSKPLDLLGKLRNLPAGFATREEMTPVIGTFGLSQRERLLSASASAYRVALDRTLRSRLILYVEKQIEPNLNNPTFVYEALKVYLMLGKYEAAPVEAPLILNWMADAWDASPGKGNNIARKEFLEHVEAMLYFDAHGDSGTSIALNGALVEESQRLLAQLSLADRAYALLKANAQSAEGVDWSPNLYGGPDAKTVFETQDGSELETIRIPKFFTYYGFHDLFLDKMGDSADQLEGERWVLGKIGEQVSVKSQEKTLGPKLLEKYTADFIKEWTAALGKLRLHSLTADKTNYSVLRAISAPTSPLKSILVSIAKETNLTAEPPAPEEPQGGGSDVSNVAAKELAKRLEMKATGLSRVGLDIAKKSQLRAGASADPSNQMPGEPIAVYFRRFHEFVDGEEGQRPIDQLLDNLNSIFENSMLAINDPDNAASANQVVQQQVSVLRSQNASRLPEPFARMMLDAANEFEKEVAIGDRRDLNERLGPVTRKCEEVTKNRYPFAPGSKREVPFTEFAKLFAPGGTIDQFYSGNLESLVDQSDAQWTWKQGTPVGRELSAAALKQFQNAAKIRDAFFSTGGQVPNVLLTVTPLTLSPNATGAKFEVNGTELESLLGIDTPKDFQWPGAAFADGRASVTVFPEIDGERSSIEERGAWALYKLFERGGMSRSGDKFSVRYVVGGREVSYQIKVGSLSNPFVLPALRNFSCPKNL